MASSPTQISDLNQDLDVQHKTWILQRIGWIGMALIILAAFTIYAAAATSRRIYEPEKPKLFRLEYDRFGRYGSESLLRLDLTAEATQSHHVIVWMDRTFWTSHVVEQIAPEPISSSIGPGGFLYTFDIGAPNVPAIVIVRLRPEYAGSLEGHIRVNDRGSVTFHQFIFP